MAATIRSQPCHGQAFSMMYKAEDSALSSMSSKTSAIAHRGQTPTSPYPGAAISGETDRKLTVIGEALASAFSTFMTESEPFMSYDLRQKQEPTSAYPETMSSRPRSSSVSALEETASKLAEVGQDFVRVPRRLAAAAAPASAEEEYSSAPNVFTLTYEQALLRGYDVQQQEPTSAYPEPTSSRPPTSSVTDRVPFDQIPKNREYLNMAYTSKKMRAYAPLSQQAGKTIINYVNALPFNLLLDVSNMPPIAEKD